MRSFSHQFHETGKYSTKEGENGPKITGKNFENSSKPWAELENNFK